MRLEILEQIEGQIKNLTNEEQLWLLEKLAYQIRIKSPNNAINSSTNTNENGSQPQPKKLNAWELLEKYAGTVEAPEDWSAEHDHYLYGTPKRSETQSS
jgi:hypothetical protein